VLLTAACPFLFAPLTSTSSQHFTGCYMVVKSHSIALGKDNVFLFIMGALQNL